MDEIIESPYYLLTVIFVLGVAAIVRLAVKRRLDAQAANPDVAGSRDRFGANEQEIVRFDRRGNVAQRIAWSNIAQINIIVHATHVEKRVDWIVIAELGSRKKIVMTLGEPGSMQVWDRIQRLPGFDREALDQAVNTVETGEFVAWKRP